MKFRYIFLILLGSIVIVIALTLDPLAKKFVNYKIDQMSAFRGQVHHVDVQLGKAAVRLEGITLFRTIDTAKNSTPLFTADTVSVDLKWPPLFRKALVGSIFLANPEVNYSLTSSAQSQPEDSTQSSRSNLPPFTIDRLDIQQGKVHVKDPSTHPPLTASVTQIRVTGENISNREQASKELPSSLQLSGNTTGNGQLSLDMEMDLLPDQPQFTSDLTLESISLPALNDFFEAYTGINMNEGSLTISSEIKLDSGVVDGYITPDFKNIEVVELGQGSNAGQGLFQKSWEALAGIGLQILQNEGGGPQDDLGRIRIHQKIGENQKNQDKSIFESIEQAVSQALDAEIEKQSQSPPS